MLDVIAWIGSFFLAICSVPLAYQAWKDGHGNGIGWWFLWLWFIGEICLSIYVIPKQDWPLIFNYVGNSLLITVVIWYKWFPRKNI